VIYVDLPRDFPQIIEINTRMSHKTSKIDARSVLFIALALFPRYSDFTEERN